MGYFKESNCITRVKLYFSVFFIPAKSQDKTIALDGVYNAAQILENDIHDFSYSKQAETLV